MSRFGYLGSSLPEDPSTRAQAEAFADLIDALGLGRVSLLAMSAGVPPSLKFAELFPEQTKRMVLLKMLAQSGKNLQAGKSKPIGQAFVDTRT